MAEEQAQNTAPDAPQAPTSDVQNGAVNDTTPVNPETAPSEPLPPEAPQGAPSEPAQPVSETPTPEAPAQTAQPENSTAQTPKSEPIDIPPFDNSPTPAPPPQTPAPAPSPAGAGRSGRDLLTKARQTIQQRKSKKLEKILSLFAGKDKITNDEVEKLLHVSDATATRHLSELERQGKIRQLGKTGHAVSYTKI